MQAYITLVAVSYKIIQDPTSMQLKYTALILETTISFKTLALSAFSRNKTNATIFFYLYPKVRHVWRSKFPFMQAHITLSVVSYKIIQDPTSIHMEYVHLPRSFGFCKTPASI